jgi:hypothetical protein
MSEWEFMTIDELFELREDGLEGRSPSVLKGDWRPTEAAIAPGGWVRVLFSCERNFCA